MLLTLSSLFLDILKSLKHGHHVGRPCIPPILFVGLVLVRWLTSGCTEGLTILVVAATLIRVVCLVGSRLVFSSGLT